MYRINPLKAFQQQNIRCLSLRLGLCAKNHYDSLGITPKATQSDVKGAYYKLSMMYHPDKNKDSESASQRFRDITEAYEVLGNVRLRKLYDKGVSHIMGVNVPTPDDPAANFYRSRERRTRPPSTGRTPIYDFDEWSKSHYGATFARDMERRRKAEFQRHVYEKEDHELRSARVLMGMGALVMVVVYLSYSVRNGGGDEVTYVIGDSTVTSRPSRGD